MFSVVSSFCLHSLTFREQQMTWIVCVLHSHACMLF